MEWRDLNEERTGICVEEPVEEFAFLGGLGSWRLKDVNGRVEQYGSERWMV